MTTNTILITGANGGVGNYLASYLLQNGYKNLIMHYRSTSENIESICKKYDLPFEKHSAKANLTDENEVVEMVKKINTDFGSIHCLVNVAGSSKNSMSWKISKQDFAEVIDGNLLTTFLSSKAVIPQMREQNFGRIINFSSIVGFTGVAGASHYCAAKAGIVGLTKGMALELASKKITVNAIALGYFNMGLINDVPEEMQNDLKKKIPMGRFGESEDVGSAVKYLISPESGFYTGQVLHLNGGQF